MMNSALRDTILRILSENRVMTVATLRADGWPQATIVGYANRGLRLYAFIARVGQKYANIARDSRVSLAIGGDFADPMRIRGLSMAARGKILDDRTAHDAASSLLLQRFPEFAAWAAPSPALAPIVCFTPTVISSLDYAKGIGHSDLVTVAAADLAP